MFTSYFANLKNVTNPLSISGKCPDWYTGRQFKTLAPKYSFFSAYKAGEIDECGYTREFQKQVLNDLDAADIWKHLIKNYGHDVSLLCYERPGEFCHRRLVADWFWEQLSIAVSELSVVCQYRLIDSFDREFEFLSNFFYLPETVKWNNMKFATVEHAYQAAKTLDVAQRQRIRNAETPGQAKKLGQAVDVREDWDEIKLVVMEKLLRRKFSVKRLAMMLANTGSTELVEGNWWGDAYWGKVTSIGFKRVANPKGLNHLGRLLMEIRKDLVYGAESGEDNE